WQSLGEFGQPDLLLTLKDKAGVILHSIIVEVKLWSPKSGRDIDDSDGEESQEARLETRDQLAKYWLGHVKMCGESSNYARTLIYLTAHGSAPLGELRESLIRCKGMRLGWLS